MSSLEDNLARFADPVKKAKRKRKREQKDQEKCKRIKNMDKILAVEVFNQPLTSTQFHHWNRFYKKGQCPPQQPTFPPIDYDAPVKNRPGFQGIFEFLYCTGICRQWLQTTLQKLGWERNMTGYDPIAASHSIKEVLAACPEAALMAWKQARLMENFYSETQKKEEPCSTCTVKSTAKP